MELNFRSLASALSMRQKFGNFWGHTFGGRRRLDQALGYKVELFPPDYRGRFRRNEVANRLVKALPNATWRWGAELVEDEDPDTETAFEAAFTDLDQRLKIWECFRKADILAGIGRYSVIMIGGPGDLDQPLERCSADDIKYLTPFAEEDATIQEFQIDIKDPRFGLPIYYSVKRTTMISSTSVNAAIIGRRVHWTRCFHIADGLLDDNIFGQPRLECVWNRLDDLEKVVGGGAEAFWKRADQGILFDLDPEIEFKNEGEVDAHKQTREQIEKYEHNLKRMLFTRGVTPHALGSDVADFKSPVESIISLISAGCGIPQRVLLGSEQGKLAAKQDRASWEARVADRQIDFGTALVVRPFVDRLIGFGALPTPKDDYDVSWSTLTTLDDEQRATVATQWAALNKGGGPVIVTPDEIRTRVLDLDPLAEVNPELAKQPLLPEKPTIKPGMDPKKRKAAVAQRKLRCMSVAKRQQRMRIALRAAALAAPEPKRQTKTRTIERDRRNLITRIIEDDQLPW